MSRRLGPSPRVDQPFHVREATDPRCPEIGAAPIRRCVPHHVQALRIDRAARDRAVAMKAAKAGGDDGSA